MRAVIARHGPVPFGVFMEHALYGPDGFYTLGGGAGRRRDFVTSPETGALFGAVIGRALDTWWVEQGRPDPFVVVEPGAGPATLCATVLRASPRCAASLRWVLVDRAAGMRALHPTKRLPLVDGSQLFGAVTEAPDGDLESIRGQGPLVASLAEMPSGGIAHVVLANELLDNLVFDIVERTVDGWSDVRIGIRASELCEVLVPCDDETGAEAHALVPEGAVGTRLPVLRGARRFLREAFDVVGERSRVVLIDYGCLTTAALVTRPDHGWLRMYRDQRRVASALDGPCDITTDIAADQLTHVATPSSVTTQAEFLRLHGIDHVVDDAQRRADELDPTSLAAISLRSFAVERDQLCDPDGLGAFLVMEWTN